MAIELTRDHVNAAKAMLSSQLINEIFDALEQAAIQAAFDAGPLEHEIRFASIERAKVIRAVRSDLVTLKARGISLDEAGASD